MSNDTKNQPLVLEKQTIPQPPYIDRQKIEESIKSTKQSIRSALPKDLKGVQGWLLVLCIILTAVKPTFVLLELVTYPTLFGWFWGCVWIVFSITAGVSLWSGKAIGLKIAKIFFGVIIGTNAAILTWTYLTCAEISLRMPTYFEKQNIIITNKEARSAYDVYKQKYPEQANLPYYKFLDVLDRDYPDQVNKQYLITVDQAQQCAPQQITLSFCGIIWSIIWLLYLRNSRRVQNTYL